MSLLSNLEDKADILFEVVAGSIAYGLNTPESDVDVRGVFVPHPEYLLGMQKFEKYKSDEGDILYQSLSKFAHLASNSNPDVLAWLFMTETTRFVHPLFKPMIEIRDTLLSKDVRRTFGGYAQGQLNHMVRKSGAGTHGRRDDLIKESGYDRKAASCLIRLLLQASQVLETGQFIVRQKGWNQEVLKAIRAGKLTFEEVLHLADVLEERMKKACEKSSLPDKPDFNLINDVVVGIHRDYIKAYF